MNTSFAQPTEAAFAITSSQGKAWEVRMLADVARRQNEADYVLNNLQRAREQVLAHPEWFAPAALDRIEHATVAVREVKTSIHGRCMPERNLS